MKEQKKATVYAYVGNNRGVAVDFEGKEHRNEWVKLNLELEIDECIEKLSWRSESGAPTEPGDWGSNNMVVRRQDLDSLVGQLLTFCDAMLTDKEQKDAWKNLIRTTIHKWHDDKMARYTFDR